MSRGGHSPEAETVTEPKEGGSRNNHCLQIGCHSHADAWTMAPSNSIFRRETVGTQYFAFKLREREVLRSYVIKNCRLFDRQFFIYFYL
jgi:hypothetical protein